MLDVYLFHGHASCLDLSQYTIYFLVHYMKELLIAECLHISWACFLSTLNHGLMFYFLVHYDYVETSNFCMSTYFTDMPLVYLFHGILSFFWHIICRKV